MNVDGYPDKILVGIITEPDSPSDAAILLMFNEYQLKIGPKTAMMVAKLLNIAADEVFSRVEAYNPQTDRRT